MTEDFIRRALSLPRKAGSWAGSRLQDRRRFPRRLWYPPDKEPFLHDKDPAWQKHFDEVSATVRRTMLTLLGYSLFCLLALGQPDRKIFETAGLEVPLAGTSVDFGAFMLLGPLLLFALTVYLHIFVARWIELRQETALDNPAPPYLFNLEDRIAAAISWLIFYATTPVVLYAFASKAAPFPQGIYVVWIALSLSVLVIWTAIRRARGRLRRYLNPVLYLAVFVAILLAMESSRSRRGARTLDLSRANLQDSYLRGYRLQRANFYKANLRNADLTYATLWSANLDRADLRGAKLDGAVLHYASLVEADLSEATLSNAKLPEANLGGAKLIAADLRNTDLTETDLRRADLHRAKLDGATIRGPDERTVRALREMGDKPPTLLAGANLSEASLQSTRLSDVDLGNTNLTAANLKYAKLANVALGGASLAKASLYGADLPDAELSGADLAEADLTSATLSGADLRRADLRGAKMNWAQLENANLEHAQLAGADLTHARIAGAQVTCAQLTTADGWATAFRDADLGCGAPVPELRPLNSVGKQPSATQPSDPAPPAR